MIHLNSRKKIPIHDYLNNLNVIPVSISYEKDPNDILKANELYSTEVNQEYSKDRKEDMVSIFQGIMGQKGNVDINIGNILNFNSDSYEDCSNHITQSIKGLYKLHPTNYAAAIMQGKLNESDVLNQGEIDHAKDAQRMGKEKYKKAYEMEMNKAAQAGKDPHDDNFYEKKAEKFGRKMAKDYLKINRKNIY